MQHEPRAKCFAHAAKFNKKIQNRHVQNFTFHEVKYVFKVATFVPKFNLHLYPYRTVWYARKHYIIRFIFAFALPSHLLNDLGFNSCSVPACLFDQNIFFGVVACFLLCSNFDLSHFYSVKSQLIQNGSATTRSSIQFTKNRNGSGEYFPDLYVNAFLKVRKSMNVFIRRRKNNRKMYCVCVDRVDPISLLRIVFLTFDLLKIF